MQSAITVFVQFLSLVPKSVFAKSATPGKAGGMQGSEPLKAVKTGAA